MSILRINDYEIKIYTIRVQGQPESDGQNIDINLD